MNIKSSHELPQQLLPLETEGERGRVVTDGTLQLEERENAELASVGVTGRTAGSHCEDIMCSNRNSIASSRGVIVKLPLSTELNQFQ